MSRKLILDERFQSGQLDPAVWKVAKTLDFFQSYDAYDGEQVTVKDGILALSTQHNANKSTGMWRDWLGLNDWWGGMVTTKTLLGPGRVEIVAKMPETGGKIPCQTSFWLMPPDSPVYRPNPWPSFGEIDIVEHYGLVPLVADKTVDDYTNGVIHYRNTDGTKGATGATGANQEGVWDRTKFTKLTRGYCAYGAEWNAERVRLTVSGKVVLEETWDEAGKSPFGDPDYFHLNLTHGFMHFPWPDLATYKPTACRIKRVRIWQD